MAEGHVVVVPDSAPHPGAGDGVPRRQPSVRGVERSPAAAGDDQALPDGALGGGGEGGGMGGVEG